MKNVSMSLFLCMLFMVVLTTAEESTSSNFLLQAIDPSSNCLAYSLAMCSNQQGYRPRHCRDLQIRGDTGRGVRQIFPFGNMPMKPVSVYCDHTVDGGGWTVFQRRTNQTVREDFYRTWAIYRLGFGSLEGEFWLGLDNLHALTSSTLQEMRVDLADYEGNKRWAKYKEFYVDSATNYYRLSIGKYSGNAGDSLAYHNKMYFSTYDADHDNAKGLNCAAIFRGAMWYNDGHHANINGYQYEGKHASNADGINWLGWKGFQYSLMNTTLMIRPAY